MALNPLDTELSMDLAENNTLAIPLSDQGFSLMVHSLLKPLVHIRGHNVLCLDIHQPAHLNITQDTW